MSDQLIPLLKQWQTLEPTAFHFQSPTILNVQIAGNFEKTTLFLARGTHDLHPNSLALLQAAVQDAVIARKWQFQIYWNPKHRTAFTHVAISRTRTFVSGEHPLIATALLEGYLKALESAIES